MNTIDIIGIGLVFALAGLVALLCRRTKVTVFKRKLHRPNADPFYFRVPTDRGDILLTSEAFSVARKRAIDLIK